MKIDLSIPSVDEIKKVARTAVVIIGGVVIVKAITAIVSKVHEKKQDKELNKLRKQVNDLDSRVSSLEKKH